MRNVMNIPGDEILDEYTLAGGVRGKYADRHARGTNLVLPDSDVEEARTPEAATGTPDKGRSPMEPQDNLKIGLQKAVNAAEAAEAALADVINTADDKGRYEGMLQQIRVILDALRGDAATTTPDATE